MTTRKRILAGNWKMNLLQEEATQLAAALVKVSRTLRRTEVWLAPAFTSLSAVFAEVKGSSVNLGAQNAHWENYGAFTGEVSVPMLKELGCSFCIVGHSERRHVFGECNELVVKRTLGVLKSDLTVVLCVGETLNERESGLTNAVLKEQLAPVLEQIPTQKTTQLVIAYEPVWAIGTGKVATPKEIEGAHSFIHSFWDSKLPGSCPPILYGGSVAPGNFEEIVKVPLVGGALVGGASLSFDKFNQLIHISEHNVI